jgi:hypothetical protein
MALVTFTANTQPPSLQEAAERLGVRAEDLDKAFGVVAIDPLNGLYSAMVRADRLPPGFSDAQPYRGPYANPEISTFGPLKADDS